MSGKTRSVPLNILSSVYSHSLTLCLPVSSADKRCKWFGPKSGLEANRLTL